MKYPKKELKVLVSAFACSPDVGSEDEVGWGWVRAISREHKVWVITRTIRKRKIEERLAEDTIPNLTFIYFDLPLWLRTKVVKIATPLGNFIYHYLWHILVSIPAYYHHMKVKFDLVHYLTLVNNYRSNFLFLLPVPFIWGPIGETSRIPMEYLEGLSVKGKILNEAGRFVRFFFRTFDIFFRLMFIKARMIISINEESACFIKDHHKKRVIIEPAIAIDNDINPSLHRRTRASSQLTILFVGQLVYCKGTNLAVQAFSRFIKDYPKSEFIILGDGPERKAIVKLIELEGLSSTIRLLGRVPRPVVIGHMMKSDIFLFPSFEGGGMVVLEAMRSGLPVICIDFAGPGFLVDESCGIKVKLKGRAKVVAELTSALSKLADDDALRARLGENGRCKVINHYTWQKKSERILCIYRQLAQAL